MSAPRPAVARPSREPPRAPAPSRRASRQPRVPLAAALLATLALACAASQPTPDPRPPIAGLLVLAGEPGAAILTVHDDRGAPRAVELPDPATAWISAGPGGRLAATLDRGAIHVSGPLRAGTAPGWRPATGADTDLPREPLRFGTWSPSGTHIAALAADFGAAARLTVAVIDPVARDALLLPLPGGPVVAPIVWLTDAQLLAQTDAGALVVDIVSGEIAEGPPLEAKAGTTVATAPGRLIAIADPSGGAVEVRELDPWLAGDRGEPLARMEAEAEVGSMALTPAGDRLAVVWQQIDAPGELAIYRRADGWSEVARSALPGESARAAVDWLR